MIYKNKEDLIKKIIKSTDIVLDIGFWGQGIDHNNPNWTHGILKNMLGGVWYMV